MLWKGVIRMGRAVRRFWWSLGFLAGFVVRDLMEDESSVRDGLRRMLDNAGKTIRDVLGKDSDAKPEKERDEAGSEDTVDETGPGGEGRTEEGPGDER